MDKSRPGTRVAEELLTSADGATMDDIRRATGAPQYNVLANLQGRGFRVRKVKEGRRTRYFATPPSRQSFEATVTSQGQVTIPKVVREQLRLRGGHKIRFVVEDGDRAVITPVAAKLSDLAGILGKPKRSATLEEMHEAVRRGAANRYLRAVGKTR